MVGQHQPYSLHAVNCDNSNEKRMVKFGFATEMQQAESEG